MRVISVSLRNFASYKELDFSFEDQGLTLLQGPTGAGKSTLCDAIPWILFGTTAKGGAVDDIISWDADDTTYGHAIISLPDGTSLWVARTRKPNDLYYVQDGVWEHPKRGKALNDTQKLINNLLGVDSAIYLSGAYFHEFSQTAQFFVTDAKNRRAISDQLVDLSLAKNLQAKLTEERKALAKTSQEYDKQIAILEDRLDTLNKVDYQDKFDNFEKDKAKLLANLNTQIKQVSAKIKPAKYFFDERKTLKEAEKTLGPGICEHCGAKANSQERAGIAKLMAEFDTEARINTLNVDQLDRLNVRLKQTSEMINTYQELMQETKYKADKAEDDLNRTLFLNVCVVDQIADIDLMLTVVDDFRSASIKSTVQQIQDHTNKLLTDHFDAEIRIAFDVASADKLEVEITKDGNICSYHQLSKGQRCLLKLCFGVAVMRRISNRYGITFNCIFFDEALDGLSDAFKIKAYSLFQTLRLEYSNIFVVEHSEALKSLFDKSISVRLENGNSILEKSF